MVYFHYLAKFGAKLNRRLFRGGCLYFTCPRIIFCYPKQLEGNPEKNHVLRVEGNIIFLRNRPYGLIFKAV